MDWDAVHTIDDWYDGPRSGVADHAGAPHHYRSCWKDRDDVDLDDDHFVLTPLSEEAFRAALELDAIWRRWKDAHREGEPVGDMTLPADVEPRRRAEQTLQAALATGTVHAVRMRGEFEAGARRVRWHAPTDLSEARLAWFEEYTARLSARRPDAPLRCPCCRCKTLDERGSFEICAVCFWEDDGQDDDDADVVRGGPNGGLSLTQARANYRAMGACDERSKQFVRAPRPEELPDGES